MKKLVLFVVYLLTTIITYGQTISFGTYAGIGGNQNTLYGYGAGFGIMGDGNTIIGHLAGTSISTGSQNTFLGTKAGFSNTTAVQNHFIGYQSGYSNTVGFLNHFDGYNAGYSNLVGSENQFIGHNSGYLNTSGNGNLFIGYVAGRENTTASFNQFMGNRAGWKNTTGSNNYFSGYQAGYNNVTGSNNYFSGFRAGFSNVTGSGNVFLGNNAGYFETASNKLYIDNSDTSTPLVYGDFTSNLLTVNGQVGVGNSKVYPGTSFHSKSYTTTPWGIVSEANANGRIIGLNHTGNEGVIAVSYLDNSGWTPLQLWTQNIARVTIGVDGNVGIGTLTPLNLLQVQNAYCDGNTWYNVSDKNMKENFARIKPSESILDKIMELPIQYWNYKGDNSNRHIGPTAQDFYKVFQLGNNEKAISTIDESGVALAAIQELTQQTRELKKLLDEQQQLISSLLQAKIESTGGEGNGLKLHQNQPNPFQRDTKITMEIPQKVNQAILYIYDLQGKIAGQQPVAGRGVTSVIIEGGRLNSGMYLYVLIGDGQATEAKRMILTE